MKLITSKKERRKANKLKNPNFDRRGQIRPSVEKEPRSATLEELIEVMRIPLQQDLIKKVLR